MLKMRRFSGNITQWDADFMGQFKMKQRSSVIFECQIKEFRDEITGV